MFNRFLRIVTTLAAVVVAYQVYVLSVVPRLEPQVIAREQRPSSDAERDRGRQLVNKYQRFLATYFAADHWSQQRPPIVIKTGPLMLVLDEYRQLAGRQMRLEHFAVLFFPTPPQEGLPPPRDAIVVEAPGGATLAFDDQFNPFSPTSSKLGRVESGQLDGPVIVRSDMDQPGPQDDLLIETSDLKLDENRLETFQTVKFRLGRSTGSGRQMEIRFQEEPDGTAPGAGAQFDRLQSLEILHDVRCQLDLDTNELVERADAAATAADNAAKKSEQPIEIACSGSFEFLFVGSDDTRSDYVATFHDDVQVWQFNPAGQSDTMTCSKLAMEFMPAADESDLPLDASRRQREEVGRLEPYVLDAIGEPVILLSPSREFEARGSHLRITLPERRIALDGGNVRLTSGTNVMRAPAITYSHPAADAGTRLGTFRAQGEGRLDFAPNPAKPNELLRAEWHEAVRLTRENDQPVLVMRGRPQLAMEGRGQLIADRMNVYLREVPAENGAASAWFGPGRGSNSADSTVVPDRLTAVGGVIIHSPQLEGKTHELAAWFRHEPEADTPAANDEVSAADPNRFYLPNRQAGQESYAIEADLLRLEVALRGRRAVPTNLSCEGHVVFRENRTRNIDDAPLVLNGQQLTVEHIDTGTARIAVVGRAAAEGQAALPAEMTARGVTLVSEAVFVDEGQNRAWIDGAGEAHMRLDRDFQGRPVSVPYLVTVRWQDGLTFNGREVELQGDVRAEAPDDRLRCDRLVGTLNRPIEFGKQVQSESLDMAKIDCLGGVVLDHQARDRTGPVSHERMELERLAIDQVSGQIDGHGPGTVQSVHFSDQSGWRPEVGGRRSATTTASGHQPPASAQRLHYLRVDFDQGIRGNLHNRELSFEGRVRTVYGPVDAWEQQLDPEGPAGLPAGAVAVRCEELTVSEDPEYRGSVAASSSAGGQFGPVELLATGNVNIESSDDKNQSITATAERASYDQMKDVFVLEGDGRTLATIVYENQPGGQPLQGAARYIWFQRSTGYLKAENFRADVAPSAGEIFAPQRASAARGGGQR